jgi:hypothetical protein
MRTKTSLQRQLLARTAEAANLKDEAKLLRIKLVNRTKAEERQASLAARRSEQVAQAETGMANTEQREKQLKDALSSTLRNASQQAKDAQQDMERRLKAAEEDKKTAVSRLQDLLKAAEEEKQNAVVTEQDRSQQLLFLLMTDVRQLDERSFAMVYPSSHFPGHARFATSIDYKKDEVALVTVKDVRSGGRYKTSSFSLCGHEWNLVIDPAKEHEGKTAFGCYLHQKTSCDALKANYQIGMLSNTSGKDVVRQSTQCFTDGFGWGGSFASDQELQERTSAGEPHSRYASAAPTQPCCAVRLLRRRRLLCPRS